MVTVNDIKAWQRGDYSTVPIEMRKIESALTKKTGNRELAKDVTQETFIKLLVKGHIYDYDPDIRPPDPWIYTIATNKMRDNFRQNGKHTRALSFDNNPSDNYESPLINIFSEDLIDQDQLEENRLNLQTAIRLIEQGLCKNVVGMEYLTLHVRGVGYKEIAKHFDVPIGTVKSSINSARKYLSNQLQEAA